MLAGLVTVLFNLDAAVVLLTPLYVRIASRHGEDPVLLAFLPALLASLASSVLPVSNLTNLVVARRLDLGTTDFLAHAAPVALAATIVGWLVWSRLAGPAPAVAPTHEPAVPGALAVGVPVVVWLLLGFTVGDQLGVPAWVVAGLALAALVVLTRRLPWQHVPVGAAALALSLGTLALGAAPALGLDRVLGVPGAGGEALTFGVAALGANLVNNLPALLVALPALDLHPDRVWAVLLGVNIGPTLWVTGALSTLLWQATMGRLDLPVSNRRYAAVGVRVGAARAGGRAARPPRAGRAAAEPDRRSSLSTSPAREMVHRPAGGPDRPRRGIHMLLFSRVLTVTGSPRRGAALGARRHQLRQRPLRPRRGPLVGHLRLPARHVGMDRPRRVPERARGGHARACWPMTATTT